MPHDVTVRTYRTTDLDAILTIVAAASLADGERANFGPADLQTWLADPRWTPAQDLLVAEIAGHGVVGLGEGRLRGEAGHQMYRSECHVHPAFRRRGVGRALLEAQWQRVQAISQAAGDTPVVLGARVAAHQADARALFESFGMRRVRYFFDMVRDLVQPIPPVVVPDGLKLTTWAARRDDRAVWAGFNEAFEDHWGHLPEDFASFSYRIDAGWMNLDCSYVAWDGDEVAGASLNDMGPAAVRHYGRNQGWIGILYVRRPWRQRGLARALLAQSLLQARALGHDLAGLRVDAENLTGAVQLYETVGFTVEKTVAAYHRVYPAEA